ncbi:Tim44 domain-containing protein [Roseospira marina]|uniref:Tim44 domain-containing protein n=1 Tax=Roseospira marina TaxID=140057 RepID=A0A5M6IIN6_9PROT|nr:Tim44/TimA family putative adaptor protein [Roseospira marina]KAA5607555.1 Tim44 domain-containing protein [Roseospira marina]MBB4312257.1 putative lipid-binding transport protein (Tim44 family) [Roseospira marina]MBB5085727.1 putative lipid-binding transport protein (Tim44 family) [Roseospira marina]
MGDSFQFIDIIFFAMIAAFLVLRLRSVLGKRTGNEKPRRTPFDGQTNQRQGGDDNVIDLPGRRDTDSEDAEGDSRAADQPSSAWSRRTSVASDAGVEAIRAADPQFDPEVFLGGARAAFEMIVEAFAKGDKAALRPLLADEVYDGFAGAIDERESAGEAMETEVLGFKTITIAECRMDDRIAKVTVQYETDQVNVVRDGEGAVVDGDPDHIARVTDIWTFARDTASRDPNWALVATRTPDDD